MEARGIRSGERGKKTRYYMHLNFGIQTSVPTRENLHLLTAGV